MLSVGVPGGLSARGELDKQSDNEKLNARTLKPPSPLAGEGEGEGAHHVRQDRRPPTAIPSNGCPRSAQCAQSIAHRWNPLRRFANSASLPSNRHEKPASNDQLGGFHNDHRHALASRRPARRGRCHRCAACFARADAQAGIQGLGRRQPADRHVGRRVPLGGDGDAAHQWTRQHEGLSGLGPGGRRPDARARGDAPGRDRHDGLVDDQHLPADPGDDAVLDAVPDA